MLGVVIAVLLALFVLPAPWGIVLVVSVVAWEIAEKAFWFKVTKRIPLAVGRETLIGLKAEVVTPCEPTGKVRVRGERWNALCLEGADPSETVVVEAVDQLTLVVRRAL
jgi:membrane protein implicated in regulation of membrane protease activity